MDKEAASRPATTLWRMGSAINRVWKVLMFTDPPSLALDSSLKTLLVNKYADLDYSPWNGSAAATDVADYH
jgi:hypothetical protein